MAEKTRGTFLNRLKYIFRDKDLEYHRGPSNEYNRFKHSAETNERQAKLVKSPNTQAEWYERAATSWVRAGEAKKAAKDYAQASDLYMKHATYLDSKNLPESKSYEKHSKKLAVHSERLMKATRGEWHGLEGKTAVAAAIVGVLGGIFFLSPNLTGNVIGNITNSTSNILGAVLLVIGLIGGFFWIKNK